MNNVATLKGLKCPYCGSEKLTVTGTKGALGAAIATGAAFGAIGNMVAGSSAASNTATEPLQYKCSDCKKKFEALPLTAPMEDLLAVPCTVTFTRESSFVGAVVPQIVYINGVKLGTVKNGKSITLTTGSRHNVIFVTDQYGVAFKSDFRFEAQPGGNISVRFKRKFLDSKNAPANIPANTPINIPMNTPINTPINTPVNGPYIAPQPVMGAPVAQPVMRAPAAENTAQPKVRFCTNCGKTLVDEDLFCPYCGAKRFSPQVVSK